jgi:hypothetical protein
MPAWTVAAGDPPLRLERDGRMPHGATVDFASG